MQTELRRSHSVRRQGVQVFFLNYIYVIIVLRGLNGSKIHGAVCAAEHSAPEMIL